MKIIVYHSSYGCDTGCCGHVIESDEGHHQFEFSHPHYNEESEKEFAKRLVREQFGDEHVKDLDWENCRISDD